MREALVERKLLPVGEAYLAHVRRAVHNLTFEEHDKHAEEERKRLEALNGNGAVIEDDLGVGDEEEPAGLLLLDPKEWKVRTRLLFRVQGIKDFDDRNKIIMPSLASHTCGT